jgi:hypothetical protein
MCEEVIYCIYYVKDIVSFESNYQPVPVSRVGITASETLDFASLYDANNNHNIIGKILFNNSNIKTVTYPPLINTTENISIQFNDESAIFCSDFYKSSDGYYKVGSKIILQITSCSGRFINKTGYVVIDVEEDKRRISIVLSKLD